MSRAWAPLAAIVSLVVVAAGAACDDAEGTECFPTPHCGNHYLPPTGCPGGYACIGEAACSGGTGKGVCMRYREGGEKCTGDTPCVYPFKCAQPGAPGAGTCVEPSDVQAGGICDAFTRRCAIPHRCTVVTYGPLEQRTRAGVCQEQGGLGAVCGDELHGCANVDYVKPNTTLHCNEETKRCSGRGAPGEWCAYGFHCQTKDCDTGRCTAPQPNGAACREPEQCASTRCAERKCAPREDEADAGASDGSPE